MGILYRNSRVNRKAGLLEIGIGARAGVASVDRCGVRRRVEFTANSLKRDALSNLLANRRLAI